MRTRRPVIQASTDASRQLESLVITASEILASRFRGRRSAEIITVAARLRLDPQLDAEALTTATVLRCLERGS
ncbi:MAG: hypothetical protein ACYDGN_12250 [Acidimicrobiales bacterium]